jgi:uncharacterized membrane protein YtjA (UPF0391 family)
VTVNPCSIDCDNRESCSIAETRDLSCTINSTKKIFKPSQRQQINSDLSTGMLYVFIYVFFNLKLKVMLRWTIIFLVIAIIAAIFGFGGLAAGAAGIAKILFFIFLVLFILSLISGRRGVADDV